MRTYAEVDIFGVFVGHWARGVEGLPRLSSMMMWPPSIMADRGKRYQQHFRGQFHQPYDVKCKRQLFFCTMQFHQQNYTQLYNYTRQENTLNF
jgi:hypothetical protein